MQATQKPISADSFAMRAVNAGIGSIGQEAAELCAREHEGGKGAKAILTTIKRLAEAKRLRVINVGEQPVIEIPRLGRRVGAPKTPLGMAIHNERGCRPQAECAAKLGVTKGCFSRWEKGTREPSLTEIERIGALFGRTAAQLLKSASEIKKLWDAS